ncbi:hypothetical protein CR513_30113, partial [Mucuna pruriens]
VWGNRRSSKPQNNLFCNIWRQQISFKLELEDKALIKEEALVLGTQRKPVGSSIVNHQIGRRNQEKDEQFRHLILKITSIKISLCYPHSQRRILNSKAPWIIDSGATDHVTDCPNLFSSCSPCADNKMVKIADDSFSAISGVGSVPILNSLTLHNVLYVPNVSCNLLSIRKTIGSGKEVDGLYFFEDGSIRSPFFLDLFKNKNPFLLSSDTGQLVKHHCSTYSPQPYKN